MQSRFIYLYTQYLFNDGKNGKIFAKFYLEFHKVFIFKIVYLLASII